MNAADFDTHFNRLTAHFRLPAEADRDRVAVDWFKAVEHYHVDALETAVTAMIREAKDTYWPPLGLLLEKIQNRLKGLEHTKDRCPTCHGSTWIDAMPFMSNGMVYSAVQRCPDCGVPAPEVKSHVGARALTAAEYAEWKNERPRDTMPEWAKAKRPWTLEEREARREDMRGAFERLRQKLFGEPS